MGSKVSLPSKIPRQDTRRLFGNGHPQIPEENGNTDGELAPVLDQVSQVRHAAHPAGCQYSGALRMNKVAKSLRTSAISASSGIWRRITRTVNPQLRQRRY